MVLSDLSFPACRAESDAARAADENAETMPYDADERYRFGITLDQVDRIH